MEVKLFDSELKVMEALWREENATAGRLAKVLKEETGWNRNTTYTVIKKCIEKGAIERSDPGFHCRARITRAQVQRQEADEIVNKMFDGSAGLFLSAFLSGKKLPAEEIERLEKIIEEMK